jgi:hypothetical protein
VLIVTLTPISMTGEVPIEAEYRVNVHSGFGIDGTYIFEYGILG